MATDTNLSQAKATFKALCDTMDANNWHYTVTDEFKMQASVKGDDLPIELEFSLNPKLNTIAVISVLPFSIQEDQRVNVAMAISIVNNQLVNGCFDYNLGTGLIAFRLVSAYQDMRLDTEVFQYLLYVSCHTIDEYNDKFLMLNKGLLTLEDFIKSEQN